MNGSRPRAVAAILAAGMALRFLFWLHGAPIRLDEARVALNLMERSFLQLLQPLAYHQAEPWGLLWLQKGLAELFGYGERVLRLPSLAAALASLPLFDAVARRLLDRRSRVVAVALFAFSLFPFLSAGYGKQYAAAAFVTLLLWWAALTWGPHSRPFFLLALGSIFFSFPAVFVAGGIYLVEVLERRDRRTFLRATGFAAAAILVAVALADATTDPYLQEFWREHMLGRATAPVSWTVSHFLLFFENPAAVGAPVLAGGAAIFGAWRLVSEHGRRARYVFGSLPLLILASSLGLWPLADRLLFFLAPLAFLCVALPVGRLADAPGMRGVAAVGILALLLVPGSLGILHRCFDEPVRWDVRTVTERFLERHRPGDRVFVYLNAEPPFAYYLRRRDTSIAYRTVRPEPEEARKVFESSDRGSRLWWITSGEGPPSERARLRRTAARRAGRLVDHLGAVGADAYLYAGTDDGARRGEADEEGDPPASSGGSGDAP